MLEATFLHAPGIGRATEKRLWQAGAHSWQTYLDAPSDWPLTPALRAQLTPVVAESIQRLEQRDHVWFARQLPPREHWRAVSAFQNRVAFVDIETNGTMEPDALTVVGVFDGSSLRQYVRGHNLHRAPEVLQDAAILVTFAGTGFDLPFLRRTFPQIPLRAMHVDLLFLLRRLGYRGGLKQIELELGLQRSDATRGLSGWDAVRLWHAHQRGSKRAIEILLQYNAEDVCHLAELLSMVYPRIAQQVWSGK